MKNMLYLGNCYSNQASVLGNTKLSVNKQFNVVKRVLFVLKLTEPAVFNNETI